MCGVALATDPTRLHNGLQTDSISPYFNTGNLVITATVINVTTVNATFVSGNNLITNPYFGTFRSTNLSSNMVHVEEIVYPDGSIQTSAFSGSVPASELASSTNITLQCDSNSTGGDYSILLKTDGYEGLETYRDRVQVYLPLSVNATISANAFIGDGSKVIGVITSNKSLTSNYSTTAFNQSGGTVSASSAIMGDITINDFALINDSHSEIGISYNTQVLTISALGTYVTLNTGLLIVDQSGSTINLTNGTIQIKYSGSYVVQGSFTCSVANGDEFHAGYSINGANPPGWAEGGNTGKGSGSYAAISMPMRILHLQAGDILCIKFENESAARNITVKFGGFTVCKIRK